MNEYFILTVGNRWETVDAFVYNNHRFIVDKDGNRRYTDTRFCQENGCLCLAHLGTITPKDLAMIARMCGIQPLTGSVPGGFAPMPAELLIVRRGKSTTFYDANSGQRYRKVA